MENEKLIYTRPECEIAEFGVEHGLAVSYGDPGTAGPWIWIDDENGETYYF